MPKGYTKYTKTQLLAKRKQLEKDLANLCMQWERDTDLEISGLQFDRQYRHVWYEQADGSEKFGNPRIIHIWTDIGMGDRLFAELKKEDDEEINA